MTEEERLMHLREIGEAARRSRKAKFLADLFGSGETLRDLASGQRAAVLSAFVVESNRIEDIPRTERGPLFVDHLDAAKNVLGSAQEFVADPLLMHARVMRSEPEKLPGQIRDQMVFVGGVASGYRACPTAEIVSERLPILLAEVKQALVDGSVTDDKTWHWHASFEYLHPFLDGNGRVGRLWMNAIRQAAGLSWITFMADERHAYYDALLKHFDEHEDYAGDLELAAPNLEQEVLDYLRAGALS